MAAGRRIAATAHGFSVRIHAFRLRPQPRAGRDLANMRPDRNPRVGERLSLERRNAPPVSFALRNQRIMTGLYGRDRNRFRENRRFPQMFSG